MAIADGRHRNPLALLAQGGIATWFIAQATPTTARKRWIAGSLKPAGGITVDAGAEAALRQGKSLLPAGVRAIKGDFERGDAVLLLNPEGREIGRGLIGYSAEEAALIIGHKSREIEALLGYRGREELIHRDDLVLR
jgi:glutamate 5-kinase